MDELLVHTVVLRCIRNLQMALHIDKKDWCIPHICRVDETWESKKSTSHHLMQGAVDFGIVTADAMNEVIEESRRRVQTA